MNKEFNKNLLADFSLKFTLCSRPFLRVWCQKNIYRTWHREKIQRKSDENISWANCLEWSDNAEQG